MSRNFWFENEKNLSQLQEDMHTETLPEDEWVGDILGSVDDNTRQYIEGAYM